MVAAAQLGGTLRASADDTVLPVGSAQPALEFDHFPNRLCAFIWRNWESVELERMAEVLSTTPDKVREIGESMGLPPHEPISHWKHQRGYITLIRRNWQLLDYPQLLELLGWDAEQLAYTLKEDDFLWVKLGRVKPRCGPLKYEPLDARAKTRCAEIRDVVRENFSERFGRPFEQRYQFVERLSYPMDHPPGPRPLDEEPIRFIYSYFAVYGDPLLHPELDPYPEPLLQRLAEVGVNGVWLHTVLRDLAPSENFPEFGKDHEKRLDSLRKLVERARKYGIHVYLYMNEPRSMPAAFFENHPDLAGAEEDGNRAMCTSMPVVRTYVTEGLAYVFRQVPNLGGIFTITASENLTNCFSRNGEAGCRRCAQRSSAEVVLEINRAMYDGVRKSSPKARIIVWDWGWRDEAAESIINGLPQDVYLMSVSEWGKFIKRGGVQSQVGEYSISAIGPGPRSTSHWRMARQRGLGTIAKVQINCTWELSAVPFIPAMNLVAGHLDQLRDADVDGLMLSWTLGGHPSPNLQLVEKLDLKSDVSRSDALHQVAVERYGPAAAEWTELAWKHFSKAFSAFPFHVSVVYGSPVQMGPANLLYAEPSGYAGTMVGIPYDDLRTWRGIYPPDVFAQQFDQVASGWQDGLAVWDDLKKAQVGDPGTRAGQRQNAEDDRRIAQAAHAHFRSVANQARFVMARDFLRGENVSENERMSHAENIRRILDNEIELARQLFDLTRVDSRIGFEASNHYFYYPLDLVEKVVNCAHIRDRWLPQQASGSE
jgi:hypothetical protein